MRLGLRLQLLLALGSLLVLAFVPLFFAFASLTRASMTAARSASARSLGRAIAGHVMAAERTHGEGDLQPLLDAQLGEDIAAVRAYDRAGAAVAEAVAPDARRAMPSGVVPRTETLEAGSTSRGQALLVIVPGDREACATPPCAAGLGAVAVLVRTDPSTIPSAPLLRLLGLYTAFIALALLVFAYLALTRLVVQPIEQLSNAARRVAEGARRLEPPGSGSRELFQLGASLSRMSATLRADEQTLHAKIAEVERYAADLERAQERLVRSERLASVGRLSAGLAHEIGNPIAAILGLLGLLLLGGLEPAEERDFLERIRRETERVHRVLRDLLDFARPAAGDALAGATGEEAGSVAEALEDVLALVKPQKDMRDVAIVTELSPDLPRVALAHERIVQVLLNLLLNAADAVPAKGGRVVVRVAERAAGTVRVEVQDNGPGIAPSIRARLFEPFVTTKEVGKGTGLGLAVCRGLVEAVGGTIGVEPGEDGGARFVLDLPCEASAASHPRE